MSKPARTVLILSLTLLASLSARAGVSETVDKAASATEHGLKVAGHATVHGLDVAQHAVVHAAKVTASGVEVGAKATGRVVSRVAHKIGLPAEGASAVQK
jgi:hypothetical protein